MTYLFYAQLNFPLSMVTVQWIFDFVYSILFCNMQLLLMLVLVYLVGIEAGTERLALSCLPTEEGEYRCGVEVPIPAEGKRNKRQASGSDSSGSGESGGSRGRGSRGRSGSDEAEALGFGSGQDGRNGRSSAWKRCDKKAKCRKYYKRWFKIRGIGV